MSRSRPSSTSVAATLSEASSAEAATLETEPGPGELPRAHQVLEQHFDVERFDAGDRLVKFIGEAPHLLGVAGADLDELGGEGLMVEIPALEVYWLSHRYHFRLKRSRWRPSHSATSQSR